MFNLSVSFSNLSAFVDIIFLKGLYFEKVLDKNNMYGFTLYHDTEGFRKRLLFCKDEKTVDDWIQRLRYHCQYHEMG